MLNLDEINKEILMLENRRDTTYSTIEKLAPLYIVRKYFDSSSIDKEKNIKLDYISEKSEFLKAVDGKSNTQIFSIIDELMETLKIANPKLYNGVIKKINNFQVKEG